MCFFCSFGSCVEDLIVVRFDVFLYTTEYVLVKVPICKSKGALVMYEVYFFPQSAQIGEK